MKASKDATSNHPLVGTWVDPYAWRSDVEYRIFSKNSGFQVEAQDSTGESLVISKEAWNGEVLTFTSSCPSTGWVLYNSWTAISDKEVETIYTYTQEDIRTRQLPDSRKESHLNLGSKGQKEKEINSKHPLVGTWYADDGEDFRVDYTINLQKSGFSVKACDWGDGEWESISKVVWDGQILNFESEHPGRIGKVQVRSFSEEKAKFIFTFTYREIWKKKAE